MIFFISLCLIFWIVYDLISQNIILLVKNYRAGRKSPYKQTKNKAVFLCNMVN